MTKAMTVQGGAVGKLPLARMIGMEQRTLGASGAYSWSNQEQA